MLRDKKWEGEKKKHLRLKKRAEPISGENEHQEGGSFVRGECFLKEGEKKRIGAALGRIR